ncbi:DNA primase large subunit [Scenedesmus sp. PABB004]|nr:DNA primase large subunit [Scenedesmus sp. PABB004]
MNFINTAPRAGGGTGTGTPGGPGRAGAFSELTMYKERPSGEISIEDFEKYALDRLRVLKAIDEAKLRSKSDDAIQAEVEALLRKHLTGSSRQEAARADLVSHHILRLAYCRTAELRAWLLAQETALFKYRFKALDTAQQARAPRAAAHARALRRSGAHAAARGAGGLTAPGRAPRRAAQVDFFASCELPYAAISEDEYAALGSELAIVAVACGERERGAALAAAANSSKAGGGGAATPHGDTWAVQDRGGGGVPLFYRVPFAAVPDLVFSRRVLLRDGHAYVGQDQVYSLVVGSFRASLSAALVEAAREWGAFAGAEADRLAPLVDSLPTRAVGGGDGRKVPVGEVSAAQLAGLVAGRHFPLCMTVMYERLAAESHLKHWGLQQFTLFLKTIGLPLEQALLFFRSQFAPRTSGEKFSREYAYNIRYNYGVEGKRESWNEWSCVKIISQEVGGTCSAAGECNGGCPYKTYDAAQLRAALARLNCNEKCAPRCARAEPAGRARARARLLTPRPARARVHLRPRVAKEVVEKARGKHYQLACGLAFEGITGAPQDTGINKPSEFYAASIDLANQRAAAAGAAAGPAAGAAAPAAAGPAGQQQQQQQQHAAAAAGQTPATPGGAPRPLAGDGGVYSAMVPWLLLEQEDGAQAPSLCAHVQQRAALAGLGQLQAPGARPADGRAAALALIDAAVRHAGGLAAERCCGGCAALAAPAVRLAKLHGHLLAHGLAPGLAEQLAALLALLRAGPLPPGSPKAPPGRRAGAPRRQLADGGSDAGAAAACAGVAGAGADGDAGGGAELQPEALLCCRACAARYAAKALECCGRLLACLPRDLLQRLAASPHAQAYGPGLAALAARVAAAPHSSGGGGTVAAAASASATPAVVAAHAEPSQQRGAGTRDEPSSAGGWGGGTPGSGRAPAGAGGRLSGLGLLLPGGSAGRGGGGGATPGGRAGGGTACNAEKARDSFFGILRRASSRLEALRQAGAAAPPGSAAAGAAAGVVATELGELVAEVGLAAKQLLLGLAPANLPYLAELFTACALQAASSGEPILEPALAAMAQRDPGKFHKLAQRLAQGGGAAAAPRGRGGQAAQGGGAPAPAQQQHQHQQHQHQQQQQHGSRGSSSQDAGGGRARARAGAPGLASSDLMFRLPGSSAPGSGAPGSGAPGSGGPGGGGAPGSGAHGSSGGAGGRRQQPTAPRHIRAQPTPSSAGSTGGSLRLAAAAGMATPLPFGAAAAGAASPLGGGQLGGADPTARVEQAQPGGRGAEDGSAAQPPASAPAAPGRAGPAASPASGGGGAASAPHKAPAPGAARAHAAPGGLAGAVTGASGAAGLVLALLAEVPAGQHVLLLVLHAADSASLNRALLSAVLSRAEALLGSCPDSLAAAGGLGAQAAALAALGSYASYLAFVAGAAQPPARGAGAGSGGGGAPAAALLQQQPPLDVAALLQRASAAPAGGGDALAASWRVALAVPFAVAFLRYAHLGPAAAASGCLPAAAGRGRARATAAAAGPPDAAGLDWLAAALGQGSVLVDDAFWAVVCPGLAALPSLLPGAAPLATPQRRAPPQRSGAQPGDGAAAGQPAAAGVGIEQQPAPPGGGGCAAAPAAADGSPAGGGALRHATPLLLAPRAPPVLDAPPACVSAALGEVGDPLRAALQQALIGQYSTDDHPVKMRDVLALVNGILCANSLALGLGTGVPPVLQRRLDAMADAVHAALAPGGSAAADWRGPPPAPDLARAVHAICGQHSAPAVHAALEAAMECAAGHATAAAAAACAALLPGDVPPAAASAAAALVASSCKASCAQRLLQEVPVLVASTLADHADELVRLVSRRWAVHARITAPLDAADGAPGAPPCGADGAGLPPGAQAAGSTTSPAPLPRSSSGAAAAAGGGLAGKPARRISPVPVAGAPDAGVAGGRSGGSPAQPADVGGRGTGPARQGEAASAAAAPAVIAREPAPPDEADAAACGPEPEREPPSGQALPAGVSPAAAGGAGSPASPAHMSRLPGGPSGAAAAASAAASGELAALRLEAARAVSERALGRAVSAYVDTASRLAPAAGPAAGAPQQQQQLDASGAWAGVVAAASCVADVLVAGLAAGHCTVHKLEQELLLACKQHSGGGTRAGQLCQLLAGAVMCAFVGSRVQQPRVWAAGHLPAAPAGASDAGMHYFVELPLLVMRAARADGPLWLLQQLREWLQAATLGFEHTALPSM